MNEVIPSGLAEIDEAIGLGGLPRAAIVALYGLGSTDSLRLLRRICSRSDGRAELLEVGALDGGQDVWSAVERAIRVGIDLVALAVTDRETVKDLNERARAHWLKALATEYKTTVVVSEPALIHLREHTAIGINGLAEAASIRLELWADREQSGRFLVRVVKNISAQPYGEAEFRL